MENLLKDIVERNKGFVNQGRVADYIPALGKADPKDIGMSIIDLEGRVYKIGQYNKKFTIQSISKVMSLILAIKDQGIDRVFGRVGYKPTDDPFNSLYKLDLPHVDRPANPMINAGAIVTTSLISGKGEEKFNRLLDFIRLVTENPNIDYNEEVYISERSTGSKNKSLAYLMESRGFIQGNIDEILDAYFKQCSIEVDTVDLAKVGLFLANGGVIPGKNQGICSKEIISTVVAIMSTCGLYDFSGEYAAKVGIPSKSGVAGGILGVVPGKMGIGVYNPVLDKAGNSIVGYNILEDLSKELNLNIY